MPTMTADDARLVTSAIRARRPAWDESQVMNTLWMLHADYTPGELLDAGLKAAEDKLATAPRDLRHHLPGGQVSHRGRRCGDHPEQGGTNCPNCLSEVKRGERPEKLVGHRTEAHRVGPEEAADFATNWQAIKATLRKPEEPEDSPDPE